MVTDTNVDLSSLNDSANTAYGAYSDTFYVENKTISLDLGSYRSPHDELPAQRVDAVANDASSQCVPAWDLVELAGGQMTLRKIAPSAPNHLARVGTDLVPTQYERGFKLWESAIDLANYLHGRPELVRGKVIMVPQPLAIIWIQRPASNTLATS